MKPITILKTTILTALLIGICLLKFYNSVSAQSMEDLNLSNRIGELIKKGEFDSAAPLVEQMEDKGLKDIWLGNLVAELIKKGEFDSAAPLVEQMEGKGLKDIWLGNLVAELIKKGEFDSTATIIGKLEDKRLKDTLASAAIAGCLEKGELKKASELLLYVENEDILTPLFLRLLGDYWDKKGFLGTSWFVLRFTFSGKIFQIKW
jgi:hypothetical protein